MANKYRSVLASGGGVQPTGNAQPTDVLSGKTFSNAEGIDKTGTMVNNEAVSGTATPNQPYTIPAGYHNGSGVVTAAGAYDTSYTPTSNSTNSIGNNLTVGKYYICRATGTGATGASAVGADIISEEQHASTANNSTYLVKATATSATLGTAAVIISTMPVELTL